MNNDRSAVELSMFALVAFGVWGFVWSVILTSGCLSSIALLMILSGIAVLSIRNG